MLERSPKSFRARFALVGRQTEPMAAGSRSMKLRNARPRWLLDERELSETATALREAGLGELEERVVAEVVRAARRVEDPAARRACDFERDRAVGACERERADETRAAPLFRHVRELLQQQAVVRRVVAVHAGETRRVHARSAAERVDLQARIVGQRPHPARARGGDRLLRGVLGERAPILDDVGQTTEFRGHDELHVEIAAVVEHIAQLDELLLVAAGEQELHRTRVTPARPRTR